MEKGGHQDTRKIAFLLIFLVAAFLMLTASAAAGAEGETELFEQAYGYYVDYQPERAASAFALFLEQFGRSSARDAALFWEAKSLALIGRTEEASKIFSVIEEEYPESVFRDFARKASQGLSLRTAREAGADDGGKVQAKKDGSGQGSEGPSAERAKSAAEVKELSARLRESEAKADGLAAERNSAAAEIVKAQKERDGAIAALRDAELKLSEVNDAALRLREREKFQKEQDEYIRRLREEMRTLTEGTKERDEKLAENEKEIALLREQLAAKGTAKAEAEDRRTERGDEKLRMLKKESGDEARQIEALTQKLQDREKALAEKDDIVKRLSAANAEYEGRLKETETLAAELKKVREENGKLKSEVAGAGAAVKNEVSTEKLKQQYGELKRGYESLTERGSGMEAEIAVLKERIARYEKPAVGIGDMAYTAVEVADRSRLASVVVSKVGVSPSSWRKGDAYEDFITEQLLLRKASDGDKQRAKQKAEILAGKYSLDREEKEYLAEYLAIEEVIGKRKSDGAPDEDAMRRYYETNKADYLEKGQVRTVKYLVVRYHRGERLGSVALVSEIQREAGSGKSFEEIARTKAGKVSLRRVELGELPGWIEQKIRALKDGEISTIFTEDQFIMLQMMVNGPVCRKYEDVREEIRRKLSPKGEEPSDLEAWLAALRKEAGDIK